MKEQQEREFREAQEIEAAKKAHEESRKHLGENVTSSFISVNDQMNKPVVAKKAPTKKVDFSKFGSSDEEEDDASFLKGPATLKKPEPI